MKKIKTFRIFMVCILLFGQVSPALAAGEQVFEFFEQEAQVVTASRRPQPVREAPVAVEVITAEEIRASGATNLWDLMRFRAGMDVIDSRSADGNRAIVSVRGFPQDFVNNLQVLVDGRSVYTAYSGGVYWEQLPVQIQDIERIEIVRGPNAALYGSNAGLGVINIITKKPEAKSSLSASGMVGNLDAGGARAAFEDSSGNFNYRLSYSYWNEAGFPDKPGLTDKDFLTTHKLNFRGRWSPAAGTNLEFFTGGSWDRLGIEFGRDAKFVQSFEMLRLTKDMSSASSIEVMASRNDSGQQNQPNFNGVYTILKVRYYQYDVEALHRFSWLDNRLNTTWGGSYRRSVAKSYEVFEVNPLGPGVPVPQGNPGQSDQLVRGFIQQSVEVIKGLTLVGAASLENTDTGGTQPAYQAAAVITPSKNHAFRASFSHAPTIPDLYEKYVNQMTSPFSANLGNPDLHPQKLQSYEVGYQGSFLERKLQPELNLFYMNIRSISQPVPFPFCFGCPFITTFANADTAIARGLEAKLTYLFGPGRSVYANYTHETITDVAGDTSVTQATPKHKVNLGGMVALGYGVTASLNIGYKDNYTATPFFGPSVAVPHYWRLDAQLAYKPTEKLELFIAGKNLLDPQHVESSDSFEVSRTYYGGLSMKF